MPPRRSLPEVDQLLHALRRELSSLDRRARRRALDEARDHLLSVIEDELAAGSTEAAAAHRAVERFGSPGMVAKALRSTPRRSRSRLAPAVIGAALIVAVVAFPGGAIKDGIAPTSALAAAPADLTKAQCADFWNDAANERWRAFAKSIGTRRASIGTSFAGTVGADGRTVLSAAGCAVRLWLALRPGHWQRAEYVYGRLAGGAVVYGTSQSERQRATTQWSNSVVLRDGELRFYGRDRSCLPSNCYRDTPGFKPPPIGDWQGMPLAWISSLSRSPL